MSRPSQPRTTRHQVFVNYRTEDEPFGAALVDHELSRRFGSDRIFRAPKSIRPGDDFAEAILAAVRCSAALLAVIGPRWLHATDSTGQRRIDQPDDWVRLEIAEALRGGVRVVPLLINVDMPRPEELPADIAALARCQYLRLHHRASQHDIRRLIDELSDLVPELAGPSRRLLRVAGLIGLAAVVLSAVIVGIVLHAETPQHTESNRPQRGQVVKQGQLTMKAEDNAYLESAIAGTGVPVTDIYFPTVTGPAVALAISPQGSAVMTAASGPVDLGKCESALAARQDSYEELGTLGVGGWVCMRTNDGNIAGLQIVSYSASPQQVVLKFTVWRE